MKSLSLSFQRWRDTVRRRVGRWLFDRPLVDRSVVDRFVVDPSVPATHGCQLQTCRRILLIRWDAKLGDAIVSSFLFRELRKANPELWQRQVQFQAMARDLEQATAALVQATTAPPLRRSALEPAMRAVEDSCEACHKEFRVY